MTTPPSSPHVNVSKPVAVAFVCVLVAALMGVAYLLGRDHERRHQIIEQPVPTPSVQTTSTVPLPITPAAVTGPAPVPASVPVPVPDPVPVPASVLVAVPASVPASAASLPDAAAVSSYFTQMDALGGINPFGDDLQGGAEKILASAMSGDSSGFDSLIQVATGGLARAQAISPPSACAHYHAQLLVMLKESADVLSTLKSALARGDTGALTSVAGTATGLQSRASALQREEAEIKARYGIR